MSDIRVGDFEVEITGPYPCWINVKRRSGNTVNSLGTFKHTELRDLQYAINRAIWLAGQKLGTDKDEVA